MTSENRAVSQRDAGMMKLLKMKDPLLHPPLNSPPEHYDSRRRCPIHRRSHYPRPCQLLRRLLQQQLPEIRICLFLTRLMKK